MSPRGMSADEDVASDGQQPPGVPSPPMAIGPAGPATCAYSRPSARPRKPLLHPGLRPLRRRVRHRALQPLRPLGRRMGLRSRTAPEARWPRPARLRRDARSASPDRGGLRRDDKGASIGLFCLGAFAAARPRRTLPSPSARSMAARPEAPSRSSTRCSKASCWSERSCCSTFCGATAASAMAGLFASALWLVAPRLPARPVAGGQGRRRGSARRKQLALALVFRIICAMTGNIYQIVLDGLATDAFLEVVDTERLGRAVRRLRLVLQQHFELHLDRQFEGKLSHRHFLPFGRSARMAQRLAQGLFRHLAERSFGIWMYGADGGVAAEQSLRRRVPLESRGRRANASARSEGEFHEFLSVWLTSLAPNVLTNEAIAVASDLADHPFTLLTSGRGRAASASAADRAVGEALSSRPASIRSRARSSWSG